MQNRTLKTRFLNTDQRGAAAVEYLAGVMIVAFAVWLAVSGFGQAAITGIKLAGSDILGLK